MRDSRRAVMSDLLSQLRAGRQDTTMSGFEDEASLVAEVERLALLVDSDNPDVQLQLRALFAATGALQETALSSGWHDEYMRLAARFDSVR